MKAAAPPSKILFLVQVSTYPARGGIPMRDAQLIGTLSALFDEVEVLRVGTPTVESTDEAGWRAADPSRVALVRVDARERPAWLRFLGVFHPAFKIRWDPAVESELRRRARPGQWLWVSQLAMGVHLPLARKLGYRTILDEPMAEGHASLRAAARKMRTWHRSVRASFWAYEEKRLCRLADRLVTRSERDATRLRKSAGDVRPAVVPTSVDCRNYAPLRAIAGDSLFFSGNLSHPSNIEGLRWFAAEVMPRLRAALGDTLPAVIVAGSHPPARLARKLLEAGIELRINPASTLSGIERAALIFVPLLAGNTSRLVVLEGLAAGRPVVSTGPGVEGLSLDPGSEVFIARTADSFTAALVRLLRDPELRSRAGRDAAAAAERHCDEAAIRAALAKLLL